jgi:hypothetical protein
MASAPVAASWDKTKPAGTTLVSQADDYIRANWAALEDALGVEHQFTAADQSCYHLEGAARITIDTAANLGAADTEEGRAYYETDTTTLRYTDDADTWHQLSPKRNVAQGSWIQGDDEVHTDSIIWTDITNGDYVLHADLTTTGGDLLISASISVKAVGAPVYFLLEVDGNPVTEATNGLAWVWADAETDGYGTVNMERLVEGLAAADHVVKARWKVGAGGLATMQGNFAQTIVLEEV